VLNFLGMNLLGRNFLGEQDRRDALARLGAANQAAAGLFQPVPGQVQQVPVTDDQGGDITQAFAPQMQQGPARQRSPQEIAASLAVLSTIPGFDPTKYKDLATYATPDVRYDRGFGYDNKTGAAIGTYHPELDKGMTIAPSGAVTNLPGYVKSAADVAGATASAQEGAKAGYDLVDVPLGNGQTVKLPRAIAAPLLAKNAARFMQGGGGDGGVDLGVTPSAAQTAADTARATAGAQADVTLPQSVADAEQALSLIQSMKADPALRQRTGGYALLPAIPGTPGAAFDAKDEQLRGKLFMQAYSGLRGGGQITEVEGKKATQAIARLNRSQSADDYIKALDDLGSVIQAGLQRAQQQPGRLQPNAGSGPRVNPTLSAVPMEDRLAEARRRGLIK
jgi:hypothetical protein